MRLDPSDIESLRPVIAAVVQSVLAEIEAGRANMPGDRIDYTEPEAAALLGIRQHVLRDMRLRGEVKDLKGDRSSGEINKSYVARPSQG